MFQTEDTRESGVEMSLTADDFQSADSKTENTSSDDGIATEMTDVDNLVEDSMAFSLAQQDSIQKGDSSYVAKVIDPGFVEGIPVPYNVAGDNFITSLLIISFFAAATAFIRSSSSLLRQAKAFFVIKRGLTTEESETPSEFRFQIGLVAETCLLFGLVFFYYLRTFMTNVFSIKQYQMILLFAMMFVIYFIVRTLLYKYVNWVFFEKKNNETWMRANMFVYGIEGLLLLPLVLLMAYFNLSPRLAFTYAVLVLVLIKLSTFYKSYIVFFNKKQLLIQNVLYFCTLELTPMIAMWEILLLISDKLIIN